MKKVFVFGALAVFALASCKKDYTCVCTFTGGDTLNIPIEKSSKKDAESTCESAETTYKAGDAGASCTL